jgi:hypothetical protein
MKRMWQAPERSFDSKQRGRFVVSGAILLALAGLGYSVVQGRATIRANEAQFAALALDAERDIEAFLQRPSDPLTDRAARGEIRRLRAAAAKRDACVGVYPRSSASTPQAMFAGLQADIRRCEQANQRTLADRAKCATVLDETYCAEMISAWGCIHDYECSGVAEDAFVESIRDEARGH